MEQLHDWAKDRRYRVSAVVPNEARAAALRVVLQEHGVFAAIHVHDLTQPLTYGDKLFHRVFGGMRATVQRTVNPRGFAQCLDGEIRATSELRQDGWSHPYGDAGNSASSPARVGAGKLRMKWFGGPGPREMVDRHLRTMPPLAEGGTMYLPGLDQVIAVDAYSGVVRWKHAIPNSSRIGILKDCGWMVATTDSLLVASGAELLELRQREGTNLADRRPLLRVPRHDREWGYLAKVGEKIIGSSVFPGSSRKSVNRQSILEGAYTDNRPIVCSDAIFCFETGHELWTHVSRGAILNPTIAANHRSVVFLESDYADLKAAGGRVTLAECLAQQPQLVALDLKSGEVKWRIDLPAMPTAQNAYTICNDAQIVLVNSRNANTVHYDIRVYDAESGDLLWETSQDNRLRTGGDHGEQDKHPVLVGDRLIVEPWAYNIRTGKRIADLNLEQRGYGCGTLSASAEAIFFRSGNPAKYSLASKQLDRVTAVTRPGCWINMIPASGLLLIPEGSSGCTCDFAVQTSMALENE